VGNRNIALFIPCYIDQFYPQVGIATLELLEKLDISVDYPRGQTCCGQPLANSGMEIETLSICRHFVQLFAGYDYIVSPSGSCVLHVKEHFPKTFGDDRHHRLIHSTYELTEFLTDVLKVESFSGTFPHRVGLHQSCHGLRGLRNGVSSELAGARYSKAGRLLSIIPDLTLVDLERPDECCGFGGTFSVFEEAVSVRMGRDRVADHLNHGAEIITATDMSCLMHLEGLINRHRQPMRVMHLAEILNEAIQ
jgi:L-lactate dehydrogenase complex protein LldE